MPARAAAWVGVLLLTVMIEMAAPVGADFDRVREAMRGLALAAGCVEPVVMARWLGPTQPMTWYVECETTPKATEKEEPKP